MNKFGTTRILYKIDLEQLTLNVVKKNETNYSVSTKSNGCRKCFCNLIHYEFVFHYANN